MVTHGPSGSTQGTQLLRATNGFTKELRARRCRLARERRNGRCSLAGRFTENLSRRKGVVMESHWSLSEHRVDPGTARCGIVWQHEHIRALLDTARSIAEPRSDKTAPPPRALASAIADIRSALEAHFAYEERHWLPVLRDHGPLGRERAEEIVL